MPRRSRPDPLAKEIGKRIRQLREEQGLTAEKLAYESALKSKGYLSDIEKGLALPSVTTIKIIADHLGVLVADLLIFPQVDARQALMDKTRTLSPGSARKLLKLVSTPAPPAPPRRPGSK